MAISFDDSLSDSLGRFAFQRGRVHSIHERCFGKGRGGIGVGRWVDVRSKIHSSAQDQIRFLNERGMLT